MKIFARLIGVAIAPLAALVIAQPAAAQYAFEGFCEDQQEFFENDLVEGWCWGTDSREVSTLVAGRLAVSGIELDNGQAILWAWVWRQHPGLDPMIITVRVAPNGDILQYVFGNPRDLRGFHGHFGRVLDQLDFWHP